MGKNYCKVDKKWCKYLRRGICNFNNTSLKYINRCPRLYEIETVRLFELIKEVDFNLVFTHIYNWYKNQRNCSKSYYYVFNKCLSMTPKKHKFDDLFIDISIFLYCGKEYPDVSGVNIINKQDKKKYGLEYIRWVDWISMFVTKETLSIFTKEEIVAACLYEMTFYGFDEDTIEANENKLLKSIEETRDKGKS